jgi:hypothetical protein
VITWLEIILLVLKIIDWSLGRIEQGKWEQAGYDKAIAEISAAILKRTAAGRAMMEKVNAMSDKEVDDGLRDLEPRVP